MHVRGRVVPVVDLRTRFGLPSIPHAIDHRIVVVQVGARVAGLLVDSSREVLDIAEGAFEKPPEVMNGATSNFVTGIATIAKRLFLRLDVPRIIGEDLNHG